MTAGFFGSILIFIAAIAFAIGGIDAWNAGFTSTAIRSLFVGFFSLSAGMLVGGFPWGFNRGPAS